MSTAAPTLYANELILGAIGGDNGAVGGTWQNSFTALNADDVTALGGLDALSVGYRIVSAIGTYASAKTGTNTVAWTDVICTYRQLEGQVGVPPAGGTSIRLALLTPNPSRGGVSASLWLPDVTPIEAGIYDIAGHATRGLARGVYSGAVELQWDGRHEDGTPAGAGIYFLKVRAGAQALQQKAVLLR